LQAQTAINFRVRLEDVRSEVILSQV